MRECGRAAIAAVLDRWSGAGTCLDVGSQDVNGTLRQTVIERGLEYLGLDISPGSNVDMVTDDPCHFPLAAGSFDVVLSAYTLEHVEQPWRWLPELARVLRPGGLLAVVTHHAFMEHRYPVDCWRVLPDGMQVLFDLAGDLERYDIRKLDEYDILGAAWKAN